MKTVLVVEDEKMIRQGIKTMILRSGVPVDTIIECNNGEMALEVIKEQKVDVMFTDIRMPKMDGIELVQKMQACEHIPMTVAISGYDDFSYAVEMLRNGVCEYILKPIEREKIVSILKKLEESINENQKDEEVMHKLGHQQLRQILSNTCSEEEIRTIEIQYGDDFFSRKYCICCTQMKNRIVSSNGNYVYVDDINGMDAFVLASKDVDFLLKNELSYEYVGISSEHQGMVELGTAFEEAVLMRKKAFCRNELEIRYGFEEGKIPEQLLLEAKKLLDEKERVKRVQLIGTSRGEELEKVWKSFFYEVENRRIREDEFETEMTEFFDSLRKIYRNVIADDNKDVVDLEIPWKAGCLKEYQEQFMDFVLSLHEEIQNQFEVNKNKQKIQQAIQYIEENYDTDLNMAVVSNNLSMNYSLFSLAFKQYTGSNFVNYLKDIRMREAKRLLEETDMKIIEISQRVGYDNEKHFMKIFKASCGVSPSEYRKNMNREQ